MTFDAWAALDDEAPEQGPTTPSACSYCGGAEFDAPTDNGRVSRATCTACKGTMVSHDGVYWQPDLIGQPDNHPSTQADPRSGGVGGIGDAPVVRREEDLNSRTAGVDWCRHRRSEHCWLPRNDSAHSGFALYIPQDRGVCPWTTASMQQINCPMSEPGPMAGMERAGAWQDPEWRFHVVAAWRDVRAKAKRIRAEGGVSIVSVLADGVTGHVNGDTGVYESQINYVPGSFKIGHWQCGCAWASYAWGRSPAFKRFEGRMCSHALALQFEAQSRGMFGKEVTEDTTRPGWMRDKVRVRHDRVTRDHDVRAASRQAKLDPEGVYPSDHGVCLEGAPIHAFASEAYAHRGDPADAMRVFLAAGIEHAAARALLPDLERLGGHLHLATEDKPDEPTHAGVVLKAADTGRILMIQRSHQDEADPAAGTWEFPGGGREPGDHTSLHSGIREFQEEVGQEFPVGGHVSHVWQSPNGVYQGHVVVVPSESAIDFSNGRRTVNPDDPDGDDHEQSAWWDPDHARKNPALRPECKTSPWDKIKTASLGTEAGVFTRRPTGPDTRPPIDPADEKPMRACDGCKNCAVCGDKSVAVDTLWDHGLCTQHLHERQGGQDPIRDGGRLKPVLAGAWHVGMKHATVDDLATSPTITRGMVLSGAHGKPWRPEEADRISQGKATVSDLLGHVSHPVGNFWHGHHNSLEDAKGWAGDDDVDLSEHVGHEAGDPDSLYDGGHYGHVGVALEAHRPHGWDPNKNPDLGLMGNSYLPHATDLQLHKVHYNDHHGNWHELDATGHTVHADGEAQYLHHGSLAEFQRRVAEYASGDYLEDMGVDPRPKPPPKRPDPEQGENPGSTGWATSQDPPEWDGATQSPGTAPLTSWSTLHDEPEPALPSTDGAEETEGERVRAQMRPEINTATEDSAPSDGRTASVTDIVERFQATAGARALQQQKGPEAMDIASAARAHLEGSGMRRTALKEFSSAEQHALITEGAGDARARNFDDLKIEGTHYADLAAALASQSALDDAADDLFS